MTLECPPEVGEYPPIRGRSQRVAVMGKVWLVQSPHEPVKVAVKSALRIGLIRGLILPLLR